MRWFLYIERRVSKQKKKWKESDGVMVGSPHGL